MGYFKKYLKYKKKYLMYTNKFNLLKGGADKDGVEKITFRFIEEFTANYRDIEIFSPPSTTKPFTEFSEKFNEVLHNFDYVQLPLQSSIQSDMKICIRGVLPDSTVIFIDEFFALEIFSKPIFNIPDFKTKYSITSDNIEIRLMATDIVRLLLWALDEHMKLYDSSKQETSFLSKKLSRLIPKQFLTLTARDTLVIILKLLDIFKSKPDKDLYELFNILFYIDKYFIPYNLLLVENIDIQELVKLFSSLFIIDSTITSMRDIYNKYLLLLIKVNELIQDQNFPQGNIQNFSISITERLLQL